MKNFFKNNIIEIITLILLSLITILEKSILLVPFIQYIIIYLINEANINLNNSLLFLDSLFS